MSLNSSNQRENKSASGVNPQVQKPPCPKVLKEAFQALSAPDSFDPALTFLRGHVIERLPSTIIRLMVAESHAERVVGVLDLVRSNTVAAQEVGAALAYLLRHDSTEVAGRAAQSLAALESVRLSGFIPIISLQERCKRPVVISQFTSEPIGYDAIIFQGFADRLGDFINSDKAHQRRMLSEAVVNGWYSSDPRAIVTLGALCSDCPELRRDALGILRRQVGSGLEPTRRGMLESALAFSAPDVLRADVEPQIRNTFLFICTQLKPSPALAGIIMEAHSLIQSSAARTNRAEKQDPYATVMLCSAATELLPAESCQEPLRHLMALLKGSGQHNFYAAFSLVQLVPLFSREQGQQVLVGLINFLGRHIAHHKPQGAISTLVSGLADVEGFDRFLYERCRALAVEHRSSNLAGQRLHVLLKGMVERSEDKKLVKEAQPLLKYLECFRVGGAE
jgi:hypothetical protein